MKRTLGLSLIVVGAAVAVALGSYSALAGAGPVASVASEVIGSDDNGDGDVVSTTEANDVHGGDADVDDGDDEGDGARDIAQVIADAFGGDAGVEAIGVSQEDVLALHEQGIGFGALFKLYVLAAAMDTSVDDLLATIPKDGDGRYEFAFGELFKEMADEVSALSGEGDGVAKNLGQLISASHHPDDAGPDSAGAAGATGLEKAGKDFVTRSPSGHGPPDHAPAHGRN